jgi:hypothetical protein
MSVSVPTVVEEADRKSGAGYKVRTRDPLITNQVLYQLS